MVSSRRTSTRGKPEKEQVRDKTRQRSISPDSPNKKRRKNDDVFAFNSDSEEDPVKDSKTTTPLKTKPIYANGGTHSRGMSNPKSRRSKEKSPSPAPSDTSSDPLTSISRSKLPMQTPTKRKSAKKESAIFDEPTTPKTPKSFQKRLEAVGGDKRTRNRTDTVLSDSIAVNDTPPKIKRPTKSPVKHPTQSELERIKAQVLGKLCGRIPIPLVGKPAETADEIHYVMERAVQGESNTLLLLGGPGTGKSSIVNTALETLKRNHPEKGSFYTIHLDGQIQTDDKIALREIARQLALEMDIEMEKMSFADTLTTFLYTLSHPSELAETQGNTTSSSVIFILDSFDEFLSHPRQALLYNLFDIAQSRKAPIAVICLGRQVNTIDGLEKRVKSRFGGRILQVGRPDSREMFWDVCKAALSVQGTSRFTRDWNTHVKTLWSEMPIQEIVEEIFVQSRDVREFFHQSIPIIINLQHDGDFLPTAMSWSSRYLCPSDSKTSLIQGISQVDSYKTGLSQLELGLLISATRLETFHALETFNFNMVYEIYSSLVSRSRTHLSTLSGLGDTAVLPGGAVQLWGRDVATRAWEKLGEIGLWTYAGGGGEGKARFVRSEVGMVEIAGICERKKLLNSAMRGWFKEGI